MLMNQTCYWFVHQVRFIKMQILGKKNCMDLPEKK